jgi:G3E family GTPase
MTEPVAAKPSRRRPPPPVPLTVITGFLGAGKTSLLNRLLTDPALADTAVLINEFGEVGLDHLFVRPISEGVVLLASGCVCCTIRGDLVSALEELLRGRDNGRVPPFSRVVLETTGLADPIPILQTLIGHPYLVLRLRLDGIVTVVDAVNGAATLDAHDEAVRQVAVADRLVLGKTDLATPEATAALVARLKALAPGARLLEPAGASPAALFGAGPFDPATRLPQVRVWLADETVAAHVHDPRDDTGIKAFTLSTEAAIRSPTLDMFLDLLRGMHGPRLLRFKGIIRLAENPAQPLVLHGVQHVLHPPLLLDGWPDDDHRSRLVIIAKDVDPAEVTRLFEAFLAAPVLPPDATPAG